jgi:hypothetical protein
MKIILDDTPLTDTPATLAEAIATAAERAASLDRVIVDIVADGRPVSTDELDDEAAMAHACDELRLTTAEPRAFVRVTMQDAADALDSARQEQQRTAELIEAGSTKEAFQALDLALNLWQAARQSLDQGAQLIGLDLSALPLEHPDVLPEAISKLSAGFEEVQRSVKARDWSALSDVLLYDLDDLVGEWQKLLRDVASHIASDTKRA